MFFLAHFLFEHDNFSLFAVILLHLGSIPKRQLHVGILQFFR